MESSIDGFYRQIDEIIRGSTIDLSRTNFMHPWSIGAVCLSLIERQSLTDRKIILPTSPDLLHYLKRMHFHELLLELGFNEEAKQLQAVEIQERENLNVQEIIHCRYHDDFSARLGRFEKIFQQFGFNNDDAKRASVIVGELGNNVFDHNLGNWPTNFSGLIIAAQNYPKMKRIECIIGDAGVGFLGSLHNAFPALHNAILRRFKRVYRGILVELAR